MTQDIKTFKNDSDYMWVRDFAKQLGITGSAISHWLKKHPDLKHEYAKYFGRRLYIHKNMLTRYITRKGTSGQTDDEVTSSMLKAKDKVAEKANLTPIQALLSAVQQMATMEQNFSELKQEIQEVRQIATEAPPEHITNPQREYLNERVRNYSAQTEIPYWRIWNNLHNAVGKPSINEYEFTDYKLAMHHLRKWYKASGISYN